MEMSTWSTPFFLLSKKMAPLRLTSRSAFSWTSLASRHWGGRADLEEGVLVALGEAGEAVEVVGDPRDPLDREAVAGDGGARADRDPEHAEEGGGRY